MKSTSSNPELQSFDRPTDPSGIVFLRSDASLEDLLATGLSRGEALRALLEMMECSRSEITYQPREIAAMLAPALSDLLMLVKAAHSQVQREAQTHTPAADTHHSAKLYMVERNEASAG